MAGGMLIRPSGGGPVQGTPANSVGDSLAVGKDLSNIESGKLKKTLNINISNELNSKNNVPENMTKDQIKDEVGKLLGGDNSHPASLTLTTIDAICKGNYDSAQSGEIEGMKEMVENNLKDLENDVNHGIDTQEIRALFNKALTFLPDNLNSTPI